MLLFLVSFNFSTKFSPNVVDIFMSIFFLIFHHYLWREDMFSSALVNLSAEFNRPIFTKLSGKVAPGSQKNPLDFGGNQDLVMLG